MSSLRIGRLLIGPPASWQEQIGDPLAAQGGATVPAPRVAPQFPVTVSTIAADGEPDTLAARLTIRRQLRSLLANTTVKLGAFLYVVYSDDPEQNGWYAPDQTTLQDLAASIGLATGWWNTSGSNWYLLGQRRTHREARQAWVKDLRNGLYPRDQQQMVYSTDFSALPALALSALPDFGDIAATADGLTGQVISGQALPAGRDGGECEVIEGLADMQVVAFDRPEADMTLGDVIVYDRSGQTTAPSTGPDTEWVELYGPDWSYSWLEPFPASNDCPVLDNGLVRVRYTAAGAVPGLAVDVWNGTAYVEQGTMCFARDTTGAGAFELDGNWLASRLVEWTPERAVAQLALSYNGDPRSRETVFVTVQRGQIGVKFEVYPAPLSTGVSTDAQLVWCTAPTDANDSVFTSNTQVLPTAAGTGVIDATATGGGNGQFTAGSPVASFAAAENFAALLRCETGAATVGAYQATLAVLQAAAIPAVAHAAAGYSTATNQVAVESHGAAGWVGAVLSFVSTELDQVNEAESIRNTGSATTSQVADATASGGQDVADSQTAQTNPTLLKSATTLTTATYRCFARVKSPSGTVASVTWKLGTVAGPFTATTSSTTWVWLDLGDIAAAVSAPAFSLTASQPTSGDSVYVDRVELFLVSDPAPAQFEGQQTIAAYQGCRDAAQAALVDSRMLGALVARG